MQLIHGEALAEMDKLIAKGVKVDIVITDPPYKTTSRGNAGNAGGMLQKKINKSGNVFKHNNIKIEEWLPRVYDLLKENAHSYIMTNHKNLRHYLNIIEENNFTFTKSLIWDKGNKIMGQYYMSQFEYILFIRKGKAKKINNCGTSDLLSVPNKKTKNVDGSNIHDTEKPVDLMEILIKNSTNENDLIIDPFMGSGTTGVACKNLNRDFIGIELDEKYFEIAKKRIKNTNSQNEEIKQRTDLFHF